MPLSTINDTLVYEFAIGFSTRPAYVTVDIDKLTDDDYLLRAQEKYMDFAETVLEQLSSDVALVALHLRYLGTGGGAEAVWVAHNNGQYVSTAVPANTALLMRKTSSAGGRSGTGRCYIPGAVEADVDMNGLLDGDYLNNLNTAVNDWFVRLNDGDYPVTPVIHSTVDGGSSNSTCSGFVMMNQVATQRRRLRK